MFSVPTGALGNGVAGVLAAKMGLPIKKLVLGVNENNTLLRFFNTGISKISYVLWNALIVMKYLAIQV